jgi:hypothetical protein
MTYRTCLVVAVALLACPMFASAQVFGGNNALFEPQIDVVNSGAKLDAQAVVSADRKYVTMTLRPQTADLLQLRTFQFQGGGQLQFPVGLGFAGGVPPVVRGATIPTTPNAPVKLTAESGGAVLISRGITPLVLD